jgi:hypothetical protein
LEHPSLSKFYDKFKNEPPETAQKVAFEMGQARGRSFAQKIGLKGNDLETLAMLGNAAFRELKWGDSWTVEADKAVLRAGYYCPVMVAAMSLKLPWEWLDQNFAFPFLKGFASAVNPNIEFKIGKQRCKEDPICEHFFEIK